MSKETYSMNLLAGFIKIIPLITVLLMLEDAPRAGLNLSSGIYATSQPLLFVMPGKATGYN